MLKKLFRAPVIFSIIFIVCCSIFYFELVHKKTISTEALNQLRIVPFQADDITYLVIERFGEKAERIVIQKNQQNWSLIEPIQDLADQQNMKNIVEAIVSQTSKSLNVDHQNLSEFGLEKPLAQWTVKTRQGQSFKVSVATETNFEGFPFISKDGSRNVILGTLFWKAIAMESMTYFREKQLYREPLESLNQIRVKTLSEDFELLRQSDRWIVTGQNQIQLDQDKVNAFFQRFASIKVAEYLGDGEPSKAEISDLALDKNFVQLEFISKDRNWTIRLQLKSGSSSLYGLTSRPTQLLKFEPTHWELVANLSVDQFRDRKSAFEFETSQVKKIFFKIDGQELELKKESTWEVRNSTFPQYQVGLVITEDRINRFLKQLSNRELDYFFDGKSPAKFTGLDMVIVHDANDQLLLQLNWGPKAKAKIFGIEKEFFLARTQKYLDTFGLSEESLSSIKDLNFLTIEGQK